MADKRDIYETLGINKSATDDEIKKAYRTLAKKYHPDLNHEPGAEEKFKEIQEAYDILSDRDKKARYDQFGWAGVDPSYGNPNGAGFGGGFQGGDFGDIGDIFSQFFGGGFQQRRQSSRTSSSRGEDKYESIRISFYESIKGVKKTIPLSYYKTCTSCNGSGAASSNDIKTCPTCKGQGRVIYTQQTILGFSMQSERTCPDCNGRGKKITNKCSRCNGQGITITKENYDLDIPAGINDGRQMRLAGKGNPGQNGGENGDLYFEIRVTESPVFKREGNNIHMQLPISPLEAILGSKVKVMTPYGDEYVTIPSGSNQDDTIKIRNKGFKILRSEGYGDLIIHLLISVPSSLSKEEKLMYETLLNFQNNKNSSPSIKYYDRVKKEFK